MMVHEEIGESGSPAAAWIAKFAAPVVEATAGKSLGFALPLAGLSFAVKDNIDVAGVPTTAACPAFDRLPSAHAAVVRRLLEAGASLAGKTNLDQFACGLNGTRSPYGEVPNAFDARYVSGGSSSGSAYVVAAGEVDFALGTDTAGSGRVPAGLNNIVGLKPSRGLLSTFGVVPAAQSADCVSIFARTVATAVDVLLATAGHDARDPYSRDLALRREPLPARFRFGVPDRLSFFGDAAAERAFNEATARLLAMGGSPVTIAYAPLAEAAAMLYESALVAERYAAVREFFDAHEDEVIEPVRGILASGRKYDAADVFEAQTQLRAIAQKVEPMWRDIDVLLVPTALTHYTREQMRADPVVLNRNLGAYTNFVNLLDYAALSVPSSLRADGLPFGITLIGPCGSDLALADLGQRYHHATGLAQGATGVPLPPPRAIPGLVEPGTGTLPIAVVGAHLSGMPLNGQLTERGATLLRATTTSPFYRLHALPGTVPPKPGLRRVAAGSDEGGAAVALEVWAVPIAQVGSFLALIPAPLGLGSVELADGSWVKGFICEGHALAGAQDVTHHGGWRAYVASRATPSSN
ncbi:MULTISPECIES: allophanate hydrolase [unclassified Variovorax]|jgi:allophanate hydrolase|uniref:allophanate hydrolase n=1 Tax=unclassified Variovorax TaxID=663243 RepID=UPI000F7EFA1D|nr:MULTISPECIES: allophanate hydrolase [unclassified Variovorax]RSZ42344.1 allophanate hydrolase [Variovorax sp. 553]RSZ43320.1 allophanate hydrolase [Variovorax sp. 679]